MQMTFLGVEKSSTDPVSSLEINNTEERGMKRFNVRTLQVNLRCLTPANLVTLQMKCMGTTHTPKDTEPPRNETEQHSGVLKPADSQKFFKHPKPNTYIFLGYFKYS